MALYEELNNLDFSIYIGGPLQAAVEAQEMASLAQVNFIDEVGFETDPNTFEKKVRYVTFTYSKKVPVGTDSNELKDTDVTISVPFLSMLTVPSLRIDEMTINFNVKLEMVAKTEVNTALKYDTNFKSGIFFTKFNATSAYQRTTSSGRTEQKEYNLSVHVKAVNDEMPAGLERIFNLMQDSIAEA